MNPTDRSPQQLAKEVAGFYEASNYSAKDSIGYLMRRIVTALQQDIEHHMDPLGLTNAQWKPLMLLRIGQVNTVAELARECELDTSAMTRLLDRLEAKGHCTRMRSQEDRRVVQLELTEAGRGAAEQIPEVLCGIQNAYLRGFSQEEWEALKGFLQRVLANAGSANEQESP